MDTRQQRERENDVDNNSDDGDNDGNDDDDGNIDDDDDDNDDDVDDIDDSHDSHDDDDDDDDNHTRRAALHCCRLHTTDTHDDKHAEWPSSAFIGSVGIDWSSWGGAEAVPAARVQERINKVLHFTHRHHAEPRYRSTASMMFSAAPAGS